MDQADQSIWAQYVVPVAEHHDGIQMYDSDISYWNTVNVEHNLPVVFRITIDWEDTDVNIRRDYKK